MSKTQFERVREWATVRGLYEKGDPKTQFVKLVEEVGETGRAILKSDEPEIKDGLGDAFVVLVNLAHLCGYTLEECIEEALVVIEKRTGKMIDGTFVKDE
jgi:NTP pyrophosphatase (non-canonical NTP hydrolase)